MVGTAVRFNFGIKRARWALLRHHEMHNFTFISRWRGQQQLRPSNIIYFVRGRETGTGHRMNGECVLSCACVPLFIVGYRKSGLLLSNRMKFLCVEARENAILFFFTARIVRTCVCSVCYTATYLCPAWIIVIETNRTALRIGRRNSIKRAFSPSSLKKRGCPTDISFPSSVTGMISRWCFNPVCQRHRQRLG